MALRTILASDNEGLTIASNSPFGTEGNPIINNSDTPDGTIFNFNGGFSEIITIDDTLNTEVFDDDEENDHIIVNGGSLVPVGTPVESESLIRLQELGPSGEPIGDVITINVYSRDGQTSNIWGFSSTEALEPGKQYVKVSGSNNGDSLYSDFVPCFTPGTRILCHNGYERVEDIKAGSLVWTLHGGIQEVTWAGVAKTPATGDYAPIEFDAGVVGNSTPLRVSPNHRMMLISPQAELMFASEQVLIAARFFLGQPGVRRVEMPSIDYHHFMFEDHEIVNADGSLSESFYPGAVTLNGLDGAVRDELLMIFPEFADMPTVKMRPAARVLRHFEARTLFAAQNSEQVVAWQRALPSRAPTRPGAGAPPNQRRSAGR